METLYRALEGMAHGGADTALSYCERELSDMVDAAREKVLAGAAWVFGRDVLIVASPQGYILEASGAIRRYAGVAPAALVGQPVWMLAPPDRRDERRQMFLSAVELGRPLQFATETEWGMTEARIQPIGWPRMCQYVVVTLRVLDGPADLWRRWRTAAGAGASPNVIE